MSPGCSLNCSYSAGVKFISILVSHEKRFPWTAVHHSRVRVLWIQMIAILGIQLRMKEPGCKTTPLPVSSDLIKFNPIDGKIYIAAEDADGNHNNAAAGVYAYDPVGRGFPGGLLALYLAGRDGLVLNADGIPIEVRIG
jgi:hypothetical protein